MKQYKIGVFFEKGYLVSSQINLVTEDYKSTEFIFEFDIEEGRKVFELKKPDGSKYIKDIINNKITLVDYDTELNEISLIPAAGTYEFEIVNYTEDSKLTLQEHGHFEVRGEIVEVNDSEVEKDTRLPILDSLINDVEGLKTDINSSVKNATEQANYAKQQGDYAKEQAQIIIDANTTATKIINDFETNVDKYTTDFNSNAEEKLEAYNQNDIDKTKAYNENAESKENSYNENASNKLKEYNDNATTKLSEYNTNSEAKTTAFNTNASEKTDAFNLNVTNKTTDFNSNTEAKTTEFNDNATTKTEEYNTNAEAKVNEFNTNVDELKQDVEDCYNNMLTNEAEGTSIHVEDSANARILALESEGNCEQVSTTGKNMFDKNSVTKKDGTVLNDTGVEAYSSNGGYIDGYIKVNPNTEYTLNGSITDSNPTGRIYTYTSDKVFISRELSFSSTPFTFTTPTDCEYISFQYQKNILNLDTIQLEESAVATEYEPYTQGQITPNPDYPQDVEVIEAYNLFDKDNANVLNAFIDSGNGNINTTTSGKSIYLEIPNNTKNITVSRIGGQRFCVGTIDVLPSVGSTCLNCMGNNTSSSITIPVLPESKYLVVYYYNSLYDTLTEQEILDSIQITKGSTIFPYVPYGYIRNKFIGKNFFNISSWSNVKLQSSTGTVVVADGTITIENPTGVDLYTVTGMLQTGTIVDGTPRKYLIEVEPNTEYTISFDIGGTVNTTASSNSSYYSLVNKKYETIAQGTMGAFAVPTTKHSKTITTTGDTKYLAIRFGADKIAGITRIYSNIQIEKSPVPTKFESYQENNLDINLQGNFIGKIGDVADTIRIENGRAILTKRVGKFTVDGSEPGWKISSEGTEYQRFDNTLINIGINNISATVGTDSLKFSTHFSYKSANGNRWGYFYISKEWLVINNADGVVATLDEFKNRLSKLKPTFYYDLSTPYEVDLGPVKMPKTYEGITNVCLISNLESNMKLKYARSTNIVVDNLAKAIVALGGEINV